MRLGLSQSECAAALGVAVETFRTWDAGRRPPPEARMAFGKLVAFATRESVETFKRRYYQPSLTRAVLNQPARLTGQ